MTNRFDIPEDRDKSEKLSLLNIATGVVLPDQASDRLLDATETGKRSMENFISSRINTNEVNFLDPLPKLKINTFSSAANKMEVKATNDKIITLTTDRELFGRLLVVAKQRDVDLGHGDGSLRKTTKSSLMSILERNATVLPSLPPSFIPAGFVIDAMALIQVMKPASSASFGVQMAEQYCTHITRMLIQSSCSRVDLVFG